MQIATAPPLSLRIRILSLPATTRNPCPLAAWIPDQVRDDKVALPTMTRGGQILALHEQRVMLDADLAELYGVQTKVLVQAVKRNLARFPQDFMFQLSADEFTALRSQTVTSNTGRGGRRTAPYAFTGHDTACPQACEIDIH